MSLVNALLIAAVIFLLIGAAALFFVGRDIRRTVEKTLAEATTEEQEIIRKRVVKAMFPPRFNR